MSKAASDKSPRRRTAINPKWLLHFTFGLLSCFVMVEPSPYDVVALLLLVIFVIELGRQPAVRNMMQANAPIVATFIVLAFLHFIPLIAGIERLPFDSWFYGAVTAFLILSGVHVALLHESHNRLFHAIIAGYLLAACISAMIAIILIVDPSIFGPTGQFLVLSSRPKALFKDPNVLGPYLVPAAIIAIELKYHANKRIQQIALLIFLLCALGIAATSSRAAWANLLIAMLIFAWISDSTRRRFMLLPLIILVSAIAVFAFGSLFSDKMAENLNIFSHRASIQEYDAGRFEGAEFALGFIDEYPLGIGPGHIGVILGYEPHNTLVKLVVENGVPSLVIFLVLMTLSMSPILLRVRYHIASATLRICTACMSGQILNTLVVDALHWRHYWILMALSAMLALTNLRKLRQ